MTHADTQQTSAPFVTGAPAETSTRQQLMAAMIGNVLEYYDFIVYAFLAATLARNFFQGDKYGGLLASFAAFGVGFLARPVGGALIGRIADVRGRRTALLITIFGMAVGTAGIGLLPTYATAGVLAPVLLVVLRLVQGLAAGGEWGSATSFIVESAPAGKRGFYGGMGQASIAASSLASSVVATIVSASFSAEQLDAWAWRLPFLFGGILLPIGLYMRRNIVETPAFTQTQANLDRIEQTSTRSALGMMSKAFGFTIIWTVSYYVMLSYMPTFLSKYAGLTTTQALVSNSIALAVLVAATPLLRRAVGSHRPQAVPDRLLRGLSGVLVPAVPRDSRRRELRHHSVDPDLLQSVHRGIFRRGSVGAVRTLPDARPHHPDVDWLQPVDGHLRRLRAVHLDVADRPDRFADCARFLSDGSRDRIRHRHRDFPRNRT